MMEKQGHVIPNTPIAINFWNTKAHPEARFFFLTHFHPSYTLGLSSSWLYPIYASELTCKFLINKFNIKKSLLHSIKLGSILKISIDHRSQEILSVTAFDANHCPGAVMFLFQGYFGNVLYTGDFRYTPNILNFKKLPVIDVLHLDNKYCSKECDFASHSNAIDDVLQKSHICLQKSKRIYLGIDALGKEDLLVKLAAETHSQIWVENRQKEILEILGLSDIVATEKEKSKILTVTPNQINGHNILKWNAEMPTCAILPSARFSGFNFQPYNKYENIHIIPLSNHSSFSELMDFVKAVRPRAIVPIIDKNARGIFGIDISGRADMSVFENLMNSTPRAGFVIPKSVQIAMKVWSENSKVRTVRKRKKKGANSPTSTNLQQPSNSLKRTHSNSEASESTSEDGLVPIHSNGEDEPSLHNFVWEIVNVKANGQKTVTYIDPE